MLVRQNGRLLLDWLPYTRGKCRLVFIEPADVARHLARVADLKDNNFSGDPSQLCVSQCMKQESYAFYKKISPIKESA